MIVQRRIRPVASSRSLRSVVLSLACVMMAFVLATPTAHAQKKPRDNFGKEFWVAYGPNLGGGEDQNVMDLYITSRVQARGAVEVTGLSFYQTFTTTPGQITTIHLPNGLGGNTPTVELQEDMDEQIISGLAVHVTSDSDVAVFGLNHKKFSSDAFMGLPNDVLGTEYRTMNYVASSPTASGANGDLTPCEFWFIAVHDSTNVTVTLKQASQAHAANTPFQLKMNKGDVYLIEGAAEYKNDLTGSLIESDQPIAVFSGHRRTTIPEGFRNVDGGPSRDHLVEELPPVSAWGDSALVVPFATSMRPDLVRIVCAEDSTEIKLNGTSVGTFPAGGFYEITSLAGVTAVHASKPILVGQYMHTSYGGLSRTPQAYGDPALALVYPVEQFDRKYTIVSIVDPVSFTGNFVNIVTDADSIATMQIDGTPMLASEFTKIPGTTYAYAQHRLQQGTHNITGGAPFGVTIYALGPVDSYAYTGGSLLRTITPLETVGLVIDFGDRVLTPPLTPGAPTNVFDTTVLLRNISEDTVRVFGFPRRIQDTDRFYVTSPACSLSSPHVIPPGATDQMTIRFDPHEIDRRMHTQITAKTDHLRAYVVDVYGRGVQDNMGVFSSDARTVKIDTLDFGIFQNTDGPGDSAIYIGNAGTAGLRLNSDPITGINAADFTSDSVVYHGTLATLPFVIPEAPSDAARITLRFTPNTSMPNGTRWGQIEVHSSTSVHIVVLKARIETISPLHASETKHQFGTTLVCSDSSFDVTFQNPNTTPITVTSATIGGVNAADFAVSTRIPLTIQPGASASVRVHFLPTGSGLRTGALFVSFDQPKHGPIDTVLLQGQANKRSLEFAGSQNLFGYALTPFQMPIYAKQDITPFGARSYQVTVNYDSVNLRLMDVSIAGTFTPSGYPTIISSTPPGHDTISFSQGPEGTAAQIITGGGPGSVPLLYLIFQPVLNGADPQTFTKQFSIDFDVRLLDASVPWPCVDRILTPGTATVGSVCTTPYHLSSDASGHPSSMMLEQPQPDPFTGVATASYEVSEESRVVIDLCDATGAVLKTIVDDVKKPGSYTARVDASGYAEGAYFLRMSAGSYQRMRKLVLQH